MSITSGTHSKFDGDGLTFSGAIIGMEDLLVDRDERVCLDSMFKLKAVVRARGEHKQKININLTLAAVKLIDEDTKNTIATHEIERISFVVIDPRDIRAFGYIYNTTDDRHQFWAIKTFRAAPVTVLALKELFEVAFERYKEAEAAKESTSADTKTTKTDTPTTVSPFYNACRNNDVDAVQFYLQTMSLEEVDRMEPNGSTALHAAAYQGHEKIVEILLQKGASFSIINKYNLTPLEEAKTDVIKQMIRRRMNTNRFISDSVEWIVSTNDADYQAHQYWKKLERYGKDPLFYQFIIYIQQNYLEKHLRNMEGIDTITNFFDMAIREKDPTYLLIAYTAETGFYSTLNVHLTQLSLESLNDTENLSQAYYTGIVARHPKLEKLSYIGVTYRGMMITNNDLKQYKVGTRILTKTFTSSSKQLNVALRFLNKGDSKTDRLSTICIYEIRNQGTALDIQELSMFKDEQEVLIQPYSAFKIIDIKNSQGNSPKVEIKLKECEPW